jgi:predicted RNA binding protein YcfA (HicA-like mRNA interferase family)
LGKQLRGITGAKAVDVFKKKGFREIRRKGSHSVLFQEDFPILIIPIHSEPLKIGLLKKQIKRAGMTVEEFISLL